MRASRFVMAAALIALAACGGKLPGGVAGNVPGSDKVPGGVPAALPGGGSSGMVDPNTCGNYAASEAGARLKSFLIAVQELDKRAKETIEVVKTSCKMMGKEIGMSDADLEGETKAVCDKVFATYKENMKVSVKAQHGFKVKYKPAVCKVNVEATAEAAAKCEGKATADVGATCSGACHGKCEGTCSGGAKAGGGKAAGGGECAGQCDGTCRGQCEGHADVKASGQCKAHAQAHADVSASCSEPDFSVTLDPKLVVDKSKAEMTLKAMQTGLPKLLSLRARLRPLQAAVESTVMAARELKDMGPKFAQSFKDQAVCITGQVAAAFNAATNIQVNVNVSVEVSAEAHGSIGGGA